MTIHNFQNLGEEKINIFEKYLDIIQYIYLLGYSKLYPWINLRKLSYLDNCVSLTPEK